VNDFIHHLEHLGIYSVLIWQSVLGLWLIVRWYSKNVKWSPKIISNNNLPAQITGDGEEHFSKGPIGPIEVDIKKQIRIDEADENNIKSDEIIKGKVITKKQQLRRLRK